MKDKRRILIYILAAVIIFVILVTSVGCNYQIVDFNYKFTKVHMSFDGEHYQCYNIESWRDYEDGEQIQVDIDGYGTVLASSVNAILIQDKCPYCDKGGN